MAIITGVHQAAVLETGAPQCVVWAEEALLDRFLRLARQAMGCVHGAEPASHRPAAQTEQRRRVVRSDLDRLRAMRSHYERNQELGLTSSQQVKACRPNKLGERLKPLLRRQRMIFFREAENKKAAASNTASGGETKIA